MKVHLVSLGCPKNLVDSEKILGSLGASGSIICTTPEDSDVIIINTCAFVKPALEETEDEIKNALSCFDGQKEIYIVGCAVNRYGSELKKKYRAVSGWFKREEMYKLMQVLHAKHKPYARLITTAGYAYLKIAEGCSNRCSYCTIPSIQGPYRSSDIDGLTKEAHEVARLGAREIIIVAQDTTRYGCDLYGEPMLVVLLRRLSHIKGIEWIRLLYAHPKSITHEIIHEIKTNHKICKYIDMPIQHINNRILQLMNRGVTRERIEEILCKIRRIKQISIRTSLIAGFPSETDEEFMELFSFVQQVHFDWVGVFPYYCEPGTKAAMLKQLPIHTIDERYEKLIRAQSAIMRRRNAQRIGRTYKTLIHSHDGIYQGHTSFAAPDIDGHVVCRSKQLKVGQFFKLKVSRTTGCDFHGTVRR